MSYQPWLAIYNSFLAKTEVHRNLYWMVSDMLSTRRRMIPPTGSAPCSGKVSEPGSPPLSNNSPPLLRNTHDPPPPPRAEIAVHVAKQTLKRKEQLKETCLRNIYALKLSPVWGLKPGPSYDANYLHWVEWPEEAGKWLTDIPQIL